MRSKNQKNNLILIILFVVLLVFVGALWPRPEHVAQAPTLIKEKTVTSKQVEVANINYTCDKNKTIAAVIYDGRSTPPKVADGPPTPGGRVDLVLSDGRKINLPQTISADGVRYANSDDSFIFWSKGNGAFIMENNVQTYTNCIQFNDNELNYD